MAITVNNAQPPGWMDLTTPVNATDPRQQKSVASEQLANKDMFLKLLIAQLKNQDPLNPADGVEFLTQLSQFTSVEQMIGMNQTLAEILKAVSAPPAAAEPGK
jgi:flagellar basal-body rod modification protein FlgD